MKYRVVVVLLSLFTASPGRASTPAPVNVDASSDYRVRLSAIVALVKARPAGVRESLENALMDKHPTVRSIAAAALSKLADRTALAALRLHLRREADGGVRNQIERAIAQLESTGYVVQLGDMRTANAPNFGDLRDVMKGAARIEAEKFARVLERADSVAVANAQTQRLPVLRLDGRLHSLAQETKDGRTIVRARVEFSIVKVPGQTLAGAITGVASSRAEADESVVELRALAVRGAVESALRGADEGLRAAAE